MAPRACEGDYVWIDPDEPAADGRFVAVRDPARGGETVVRQLVERDPLQRMWLSRFRRTVAGHVTGTVSDRLAGPLSGGRVTVGG